MIGQAANPSGPQSDIAEYGQELPGIQNTDSGMGLCVTQKHMWDTELKFSPQNVTWVIHSGPYHWRTPPHLQTVE